MGKSKTITPEKAQKAAGQTVTKETTGRRMTILRTDSEEHRAQSTNESSSASGRTNTSWRKQAAVNADGLGSRAKALEAINASSSNNNQSVAGRIADVMASAKATVGFVTPRKAVKTLTIFKMKQLLDQAGENEEVVALIFCGDTWPVKDIIKGANERTYLRNNEYLLKANANQAHWISKGDFEKDLKSIISKDNMELFNWLRAIEKLWMMPADTENNETDFHGDSDNDDRMVGDQVLPGKFATAYMNSNSNEGMGDNYEAIGLDDWCNDFATIAEKIVERVEVKDYYLKGEEDLNLLCQVWLIPTMKRRANA